LGPRRGLITGATALSAILIRTIRAAGRGPRALDISARKPGPDDAGERLGGDAVHARGSALIRRQIDGAGSFLAILGRLRYLIFLSFLASFCES
jgi:hypothetical protein